MGDFSQKLDMSWDIYMCVCVLYVYKWSVIYIYMEKWWMIYQWMGFLFWNKPKYPPDKSAIDLSPAVVTAPMFKISWGMCSKFRLQKVHLPRSWLMDQWLLGAIHALVGTAPQFRISSMMCCQFRPPVTVTMVAHLQRYWQMDRWLPGAMEMLVIAQLFRISFGICRGWFPQPDLKIDVGETRCWDISCEYILSESITPI